MKNYFRRTNSKTIQAKREDCKPFSFSIIPKNYKVFAKALQKKSKQGLEKC